MNIDTSIVDDYLNDKSGFKKHWLFHQISGDGRHMFENPPAESKQAVTVALKTAVKVLGDFHPYNFELFSRLFLKWKKQTETANVLLAVGCPAPYDAMVREHLGEEYIVFDLIRLLDYQRDISALITPLCTHEMTHICIRADHPLAAGELNYRDKLGYITFDEGFAHFISFRDGIENFDFTDLINEHYDNSLGTLLSALSETDEGRQSEYLDEANCGKYWTKYAAICGKLYLASHLDSIDSIYRAGPTDMLTDIVREANRKPGGR